MHFVVNLFIVLLVCYIVATNVIPEATVSINNNQTTPTKGCSNLTGLLTNIVVSPANFIKYAVGDVIRFSCPSNETLILVGQTSATCTEFERWNISDMPYCAVKCIPIVSSTENNSMTSCSHAGCSSVYQCEGNKLHIKLTVTCSTSGQWVPDPQKTCAGSIHHNATATEAEVISKSHGEETTSEWHTAFTTRTQWTGTLLRHQHTYSVIFKIISLPDDDVMNATLLIGDYSDIYITVAGNDSNVVFRPIYLTPVDNILFNWTAINGTLEHHKSDDTWVYIGRIITWSQEGSEDKSSDGIIVLRPFVYKPLPRSYNSLSDPSSSASPTSLALGVCIAIIAILVAAALATYCVRHKLDVACTIPRSFSSFENPVYDLDTTALK